MTSPVEGREGGESESPIAFSLPLSLLGEASASGCSSNSRESLSSQRATSSSSPASDERDRRHCNAALWTPTWQESGRGHERAVSCRHCGSDLLLWCLCQFSCLVERLQHHLMTVACPCMHLGNAVPSVTLLHTREYGCTPHNMDVRHTILMYATQY